MSKTIFVLTVSMALGGAAGLLAADEHTDMAAMMESHMNSPVHREVMTIYGLPEMQTQLGLSAPQTADLQRLKKEFLAKSDDVAGQIAARRKELDALLAVDNPKSGSVKSLFEKLASLHAELQFAGFETPNKMRAVLTSEQRTKLDGMKPMDVHHVVMSSAKMSDVEQTLQRLGFDEGPSMKMGMQMDMKDKSESKGGMGKMGMDVAPDAPAADSPHNHH